MTDPTPTPHDALVKALLDAPARAAAVLKENLPATVQDRLSDDLPEPLPGSYLDPDLLETHSDRLFQARLRDGRSVFLYVLIEHTSRPEPGIPVQVLGYMQEVWRRYAERTGQGRAERYRKLPLFVPLLLSNEQPTLSLPFSLRDCIDAEEELSDLQSDSGYQVPHSNPAEQDDAHSQDPIVDTVFRALSWAFVDDLNGDDLVRLLRGLPPGHSVERPLLAYIARVYGSIDETDLRQAIEQTRPGQAEELVMTVAEQWIQQGEEKGRQAEGSELLLLQLQAKFDSIALERCRERVERANEATIRRWSIRLLTAETIDDVFADG